MEPERRGARGPLRGEQEVERRCRGGGARSGGEGGGAPVGAGVCLGPGAARRADQEAVRSADFEA